MQCGAQSAYSCCSRHAILLTLEEKANFAHAIGAAFCFRGSSNKVCYPFAYIIEDTLLTDLIWYWTSFIKSGYHKMLNLKICLVNIYKKLIFTILDEEKLKMWNSKNKFILIT